MTIGGDATFAFSIQVNNRSSSFEIDTTGRADHQAFTVPEGIYTIAEVPLRGWDLTQLSCSGGNTTVSRPASATIALRAGDTVTCTWTNTKRGEITVVKDAVGGDGVFSFDSRSSEVGAFDLRTSRGTSRTFSLVPGEYIIGEVGIPRGWDFTGLACRENGAQDSTVNGDDATIKLRAGGQVQCTWTNTKRGEITVVKDAVGGDGRFSFASRSRGIGAFDLRTSRGTSKTFSLVPGTYIIGEVGIPSRWDLTSLNCRENGRQDTTVNGDDATISLQAGEQVQRTWTNTKRGSITIDKVVTNGPQDLAFQFGSNDHGRFTLSADDTPVRFDDVPPNATYRFIEVIPPNGWQRPVVTGRGCSLVTVANGQLTFEVTVGPGATTACTVKNDKVSTLRVEKLAPAFPATQRFSFDFARNAPPDGIENFGLVDGELTRQGELQTGVQIELVELNLVSVEPISIGCVDTSNANAPVPATVNLATGSIKVTPAGTEDLLCTYTNVPRGSLTIVKDTQPNQDTNFAFTASGLGVASFTLDDATPDDFDAVPALRKFAQLLDGTTATVTELVPFGFELQPIVCAGATASTVVVAGATVTVTIANGEQVVCTFTNIDTDADNDGLTDEQGRRFGTDPNNPDTDGDGVPDGEELLVDNTNPRDPRNMTPADAPVFSPPIAPSGSTLTKYAGGSVQELLDSLEAAGATSARLTLPSGQTATLIVTQLEFVNAPFFDVFFDIDVALDNPADLGIDSFFDLQIPPCTVISVRSVN